MRLIRFLFRVVVKTVGMVLILLLVLVAGLWARGRFFSADNIDLGWAHRCGDGEASVHTTQLKLGSAAYVNDVREAESQSPTTQPAATQPAAHAAGLELLSHNWQSEPGYIVVGAPDQPNFSLLGFQYGQGEAGGQRSHWVLAPYWLATTVLGVITILWLAIFGKLGRRTAIYCPSCRYDLRQPIRRCPECGAQLSKALHVC